MSMVGVPVRGVAGRAAAASLAGAWTLIVPGGGGFMRRVWLAFGAPLAVALPAAATTTAAAAALAAPAPRIASPGAQPPAAGPVVGQGGNVAGGTRLW